MHITIDLSLRLVRCKRVWLSIMFVISLEHTELELGQQLLLICRWLSNNNTDEYDGARPQKTNHAKQEKQKQNDNNKKTIMRLLHTYIHTYVFMYVPTTTRLLFYHLSIRRPFLVLRLFWTLPSFTFALTQGWRSHLRSPSLYLSPTSNGCCEREPSCAWAWRRASSTKRARSSNQSLANSEALRLAAQATSG